MVSRLEIVCVIQPNTLLKDGKLCSIFTERNKNTEDVEQLFEACIFDLQVNERGEDSAASLLLFDS